MTRFEETELDHLNHTLKIIANELRDGKFIAAYARVNSAQGVVNALLNRRVEDTQSVECCSERPCD